MYVHVCTGLTVERCLVMQGTTDTSNIKNTFPLLSKSVLYTTIMIYFDVYTSD